jgi:hypothetical protein
MYPAAGNEVRASITPELRSRSLGGHTKRLCIPFYSEVCWQSVVYHLVRRHILVVISVGEYSVWEKIIHVIYVSL